MDKKTIIDKIWDRHVVSTQEGHPSVFAIDLMLIHEVTSAQAFQALRDRGLTISDRSRFIATLDHSIPTRQNRLEIYDTAAKNQVETLRRNCEEFEIPLCDFESGHQGVVHVIGPELGLTQPGMTICCGDSHTSTHGAFGALAFGVGTSEVSHVLTTGCLLQRKPKTMHAEFKGSFPKGVYPKDAIMALIREIGTGGGTGYVIEYAGEAVRSMSMEGRMTMCNMSIECGARAGLISPDEVTYEYIKGRKVAPSGDSWVEAKDYWESFLSDEGAEFDRYLTIDVSKLEPMITWGTNPGQACGISEKIPTAAELPAKEHSILKESLDYIALAEGASIADTPVDWAFIGSCTNGRIEDLREAAEVLRGHSVHESVTMYVVPGSEAVRAQAIHEGLDTVFADAGADFRMPGCSMCLAMNDDKVPVGMRCISSSNRNFIGRQGPGSRTHLASPATVAASAIAGKIVNPMKYL